MGILATQRPGAGAQVKLYEVGATKQAMVSLLVTNTAAGESKATVWLMTAAGVPGEQHKILHQFAMPLGAEPKKIDGLALAAGNSIYVSSDTGAVNFTALGVEIQ